MSRRPQKTLTVDAREAIRSRMAELGLSQGELARRSGMAKNRISEFLSGRRDITSENLRKLMIVLGLRFATTSKYF